MLCEVWYGVVWFGLVDFIWDINLAGHYNISKLALSLAQLQSQLVKLFMALQQNRTTEQRNKKVTENSGSFVPPLLRKWDQS